MGSVVECNRAQVSAVQQTRLLSYYGLGPAMLEVDCTACQALTVSCLHLSFPVMQRGHCTLPRPLEKT